MTVREAAARTAGDRSPVELDQSAVGRLSRMDAMQQQAMAVAQERRRSARLDALQAALRRIEMDDFGWCEACGDPIAERRLEIDPTATRCINCAGG